MLLQERLKKEQLTGEICGRDPVPDGLSESFHGVQLDRQPAAQRLHGPLPAARQELQLLQVDRIDDGDASCGGRQRFVSLQIVRLPPPRDCGELAHQSILLLRHEDSGGRFALLARAFDRVQATCLQTGPDEVRFRFRGAQHRAGSGSSLSGCIGQRSRQQIDSLFLPGRRTTPQPAFAPARRGLRREELFRPTLGPRQAALQQIRQIALERTAGHHDLCLAADGIQQSLRRRPFAET